ncbi:unnamed protein product [Didymodactylos carnosus]|uniref:Cytidyltransferase-like domain-containing protein n=1 Tax=Didymodactylos carnosus TaxID=1234261 RepID=A0A815N4C3_9BILA|nr:unnamed protein product [Didymodactylos carnosus]CAF1429070.1 unnamed protein product [Didymodactylos carnosus]CAF4188966.1 unnamed protein product [Didymodactylos carnosus]CAF4308419.1 unnamed protein product [Didymodactylos carnosus]
MTGSFNPIHPLHLQNLQCVKDYLETEHQPAWNVLAGYISPTHDEYVHSKLRDPAWIPARDRCQLCEEAIDDVTINHQEQKLPSWVSVTRGESEWADGFVDFAPVTENFRDFLNDTLVEQEKVLKYRLSVIYVCGLDHFNKCSDVRKMAELDNIIPAVVFRSGNDEQMISRSCKSSRVIYIPLTKQREKSLDVSSTQIREHFQNPSAKFIIPGHRSLNFGFRSRANISASNDVLFIEIR